MKKRKILFIILLGIIITSCNRNIENFPFVSLPYGSVFKTTEEILNIGPNNVLDTIYVGDTIVFQSYSSGVYNNLKELHITSSSDSNAVEFIWPRKSRLDSLFLPTSNYDEGMFMMDGENNGLYLFFRYVPLKEDPNLKLTFKVVSDASPAYNTYAVIFKTPVKAAKQ